MTSVGVMASSVVSGVCTPVLREPFDNLAAWTTSGTPPIVAGRTGTAVSIASNSSFVHYTVAAPNGYLTLGFAWRTTALTNSPYICQMRSSTGGNVENSLNVDTAGTLRLCTGIKTATLLGSSAAGTIAINTWYYIEIQARLHDTLGSATVRVNGAPVITVTNVDTKAVGTTYDNIRLLADVGSTSLYDDLYLTTGAGCAFQGDQTIVNTGPDVLLEPFYNFTAWTLANTPTIAVGGGRTGDGASFVGASAGSTKTATYTIPSGGESDTVTIGFAWKATSLALTSTPMMELRSDAGATLHGQLSLRGSDNNIQVNNGTGGGIGSAPHGLVAGTFAYIEWQMKLADSGGFTKVRVNGVEVINVASIDTKNAGTKTVYDSVRLVGPASGVTSTYDDLYVTVGAGAAFKGSITIP